MNQAVVSLNYLPNIEWFSFFFRYDTVWIERHENFVKSSYRSRCEIYSANGKLSLSIPIKGGRDHHQSYINTCISMEENWGKNHWQSIVSAYAATPFFDYYSPTLLPLFQQPDLNLFEFNLVLLEKLFSILKVDKPFLFTPVFQKLHEDKADFRGKAKDNTFHNERYYQIFEVRHGFIPNLSILDLLFHEGPASLAYLQRQQ